MADMILSDMVQGGSGSFSTSSLTRVSAGHGISFTPSSPRILIMSIGAGNYGSNSVNGSGFFVGIMRSTVGIPVAGNAPAAGDVIVDSSGEIHIGTSGYIIPFSLANLDSGLTTGTKYYYYYIMGAASSGTASLQFGDIIAESR